jgi:hypothetical protein
VIILMNKGDETAPNPNATAVIRAGDLADRVAYYRHDVAHAADPHIPNNPHQFLLGLPITPSSTLEPVVEMAKQRQVAEFFALDGQFDLTDPEINLADVRTPDGTPLFEVPIAGPLPEDLNFITAPPPRPPSPPPGAIVSPPSPFPAATFAAVIQILSPLAGIDIGGGTLLPVLPRPERLPTAAAWVPVSQPGEPAPLAPAWSRRAAPPPPLPLLDRLFAGLDSSLPFDGLADGGTHHDDARQADPR